MPGLFGGTHQAERALHRVRAAFERVWGPVPWQEGPRGGGVGAHAFAQIPISTLEDGSVSVRDGESAIYRSSPPSVDDHPVGGNVAWLLPDGAARIETDSAGVFPLYYTSTSAGFLFSTLLRPLARAVGAEIDPIGFTEFVRFAHTFAGRTVFKGIRRLQPGQAVVWTPQHGADLFEGSAVWTSRSDEFDTPREAAERLAPMLARAIDRALPSDGVNVLMMSAGWDSRSLLAATRGEDRDFRLTAYSHGDVRSRELRIARKLSAMRSVPWRGAQIGAEIWGLDHLDATFARSENLLFPHWSKASEYYRESGACLFSGVLGEVLGGHYGATQVASGLGKAAALARALRDGGKNHGLVGNAELESTLLYPTLPHPWYLRDDVEPEVDELTRGVNEDVVADLERLRRRGIVQDDLLLEAFITEHRGVQYISAQSLASRSFTDVALPFAAPDLFGLAASIPTHLKVHNQINREIGRLLDPSLSRLPLAATLVPASWSLTTQEASRLVRRVYEESRWAISRWSRGLVPRPRLGWLDFDFMGKGDVFADVIHSLQGPMWNLPAMERRARVLSQVSGAGRGHPLFDQMGKILTVDRMIS